MAQPVKVLVVASHPVQYATPLYRVYARDPRLDLTVAYCSLQGAERGADPEFGIEYSWDVALLDGYRWVQPKNRSRRPGLQGFGALVNPGLWRIVRRGRYDVVVCYGWWAASFWIAALAAKLSGARLVFGTDANTLAARDRRSWKSVAKRLLIPRALNLADAVFSPSSSGRALVGSLGVQPRRTFLVPYVVDNTFFASRSGPAQRARVRQDLGVPDSAFVALFTGKLVPWKRPGDFLDALARVSGAWGILIGEGELRTDLQRRATELGIADRCRFVGFVNQTALPAHYSAADVLVLPSEFEPFGLVVNEAFACGVPAVVSDACGAAGDLIEEGVTGFTYPAGDFGALADRLCAVAADRSLLASLGDRAKARIAAWGVEQNAAAFAQACVALGRGPHPERAIA